MSICCPWMSRKHYDDVDDQYNKNSGPGATVTETTSLLKNGGGSLVDAYIASYRTWEDDINIWSDPYDISHTRSDQDRELDVLIRQWRKASSEAEKNTIYRKMQAIRIQRKRVQDRWVVVLSELGFKSEADKLVSISAASGMALPEPPSEQAVNLHQVLVYQTDLFSDGDVQDRRYTIVMDRLIALDVADDFIDKAKELYPKVHGGI